MSGGMDIDWNVRQRMEKEAQEKFGNLSKEELDNKSEEIRWTITGIESVRNMLDDKISGLRKDMELLWIVYKMRKNI